MNLADEITINQILMSLFTIADARRYSEYCQDGCSHWWHCDLSDRQTLDEICHEFQQTILV